MSRLVFCFVLLGSLLSPAAEKRKQPKRPELEVVEASAHRTESDVALDGTVLNSCEKTLHGVVLLFDFLAANGKVIATKKIALDKETLEPGDSGDFHVRVVDPVRAVQFRINSVDGQERDLRVAKNGPFPIG